MNFLRKISLILLTAPALVQASPLDMVSNWFKQLDKKYEQNKKQFAYTHDMKVKHLDYGIGATATVGTFVFGKKALKSLSHRNFNKFAWFGTGVCSLTTWYGFKQAIK